MKTQYYTATTLDGFIADPDDSLEWLFGLGDPEESDYNEFISDIGAVAMGSATYEWVLDHLSKVTEHSEKHTGQPSSVDWPYSQPSWIFSSRDLQKIDGADIQFVNGDVGEFYPAMKKAAEGKNIWVVGGGDLAGQFYDAGLLDEVLVHIGSATLGEGKPLLPRRIGFPSLRLESCKQIGHTFAALRYSVVRK